jgi:type IV secretion system protein TrbJ
MTMNIEMCRITRRSLLSVSIAGIYGVTSPVRAGLLDSIFGGGIAGATEWTQLLNWAILTKQLVEETTQTIQGVRNLLALPKTLLDQILAPASLIVGQIKDLQTSVSNLRDSAKSVGTMWQRQTNEMVALRLNPAKYFAQERSLAEKRGGEYKRQWDQDQAALNSLERSATVVRSMASQVSGISGNVQGLQMLNTHTNMVLQELQAMRTLMTKTSVNSNQDRMDAEQAKAIKAKFDEIGQNALKELHQRDKAPNNTGFKAAWEQ